MTTKLPKYLMQKLVEVGDIYCLNEVTDRYDRVYSNWGNGWTKITANHETCVGVPYEDFIENVGIIKGYTLTEFKTEKQFMSKIFEEFL